MKHFQNFAVTLMAVLAVISFSYPATAAGGGNFDVTRNDIAITIYVARVEFVKGAERYTAVVNERYVDGILKERFVQIGFKDESGTMYFALNGVEREPTDIIAFTNVLINNIADGNICVKIFDGEIRSWPDEDRTQLVVCTPDQLAIAEEFLSRVTRDGMAAIGAVREKEAAEKR